MLNKVLNIENLVDNSNRGFDKRILLENEESSLNIVGLKKNEVIDNHTSPVNVAVLVISGEIELHIEPEEVTLKKRNIYMFEKDKTHKVIAKEDSLFFVIRI